MIIFETINEEKIHLLKKENTTSPYFLRMGWASTNKSLILPDKDSSWTSKKNIFENETFFLSGTIIKELKLKEKYHLMKTS